MPIALQSALYAAGARVDAEPAPLSSVLPSTRLVVHNGGSGVAAEALAAGVPQMILSAQIEQDLNGAALERAGVAKLVRTHAPGAAVPSAFVEAAADDPALARRAAELGEWHRDRLKSRNALTEFEQTCLLLLAS
jgi:UDP:flavonoid glycosyltransferase YjiC (YdhE family)